MISHMSHNLLICIEDKMAFCPQQRSKGDPGRTAGLQTPLRTAVHWKPFNLIQHYSEISDNQLESELFQ